MAAKLSYRRALWSRQGRSCSARKAGTFVFILAATLLLCSWVCEPILAADPTPIKSGGGLNSRRADSGLPRYRVFSLRHISAEQGKKYLAEAKIGTVSQLPGTSTLLMTGQRTELIKASAILKLVDANEPFVIKEIFPASAVKKLPSNEEISAEVGNLSIGTFSEPPTLTAKTKAISIIDIHNDAVIAVAPASELGKIISAIEQLQGRKAPAASFLPAPPLLVAKQNEGAQVRSTTAEIGGQSETGDSESDELFDKLLGSLAEAGRKIAESQQVETEPNKPGTVVTVPEPNEPAKPFVGPAQPKEPDLLAAILERLDSLEAAIKRGPEPERTKEQVAAKIEKPGEVAEPVSKVRSYEPEPVANGDEVLEVDLPEKINIIQLLDLVSEFLGYDYMYDPADVAGLKGEVTITIRKIKVKHLYPLLEAVLKFKGFVMIRDENLLVVRPIAKATEMDSPLDPERVEIGDVIITRFFELKHIDTGSAQNLLAGMKLGVSITPLAEAKKLIITEYASRMTRIEELLEMIDKPGEPKKFRFRPLKYTMANALAPKVKLLAEQLGTVSITIGAITTTARKAPPSRPRPGETAAQRRAREAREAATRAAAARAAAARAATVKPAAGAPTVYLDADERTNRILMIGLAEQLDIVDELIDTLDVEKQDLRTLRLYEIQHVDAEEVVNKLGELGIISGSQAATRGPSRRISRTTSTATKVGSPTVPATSRTAATEEPLVEEPQVVIIESTNSLLVNATAEQHTQIAVIIGYVDSEAEQGVIPYVVYPLENQDPVELATVLNKLIMETTATQDKDAKILTTTTRRTEEDIIIIDDPKTYSLIVYASKKNQQWISALIEQLDEYRPQVLLDVTLVEVTKNDEFNYDLNIISSFPDLVSTSGLTGVIVGEGAEAITSSTIVDLLNSKNMDRFIDLQAQGGSFTGFYGDRHINLLLTAVHKKNYGRILAKPKLLVNDNEKGNIKAEEQTFVVRTETSFIPGAEPGSSIPVEKDIFEPYTAGIQLDIEPHISKGDQLRLTITLTRTDFRITEEVIKTGKPPDTISSDVSTVVTVPDGTTIILGGLERLSQSKGGSKVPILGDIPIIGGLFRSTANTDTQSRLYVFVKAHILRPGEEVTGVSDVEVVSAKNRATFERYEKEMQEYEDWPGIKPKPMDPVQILEADEESGG